MVPPSQPQKRVILDYMDGALFGNDAGEDEAPDILDSYFVDQPAFQPFFSRKNSFRIAKARKGMGKSALLSKLAFDLEKDADRPLVVKITGANLVGILSPPKGASFLELQNYWQRVICARVNYALGGSVGFAFTDRDMALVESAEIAGFKSRNLIGSLLHRIKSSKIPVEVTPREAANHEELLRRAADENAERRVWLLVDDIDSTYIDTPEQQALVSTFFSACRALVRDVHDLSIRVTVRTDVWSNLRKNEDLDKAEQYITEISWSAADLKIILSKKVWSWLYRSDFYRGVVENINYRSSADSLLEFAFVRRVRWGASMVPPFRPVYVLSAGRPRWMAQLCRLAGVQASRQQKELIGTGEINGVMKTYSSYRLSDIYKEHEHQYANLQRLIETFSNSPAIYTTDDLMSQLAVRYVNIVGAGNIAEIDGFPYSSPLQLAHFLFKIGFIVGRREHNGQFDNADFVRFEERPELLTDGRNADDGLLWEVHPAYRDALTIGKERKAAQGAETRMRRPQQGKAPEGTQKKRASRPRPR